MGKSGHRSFSLDASLIIVQTAWSVHDKVRINTIGEIYSISAP